MNKQVQTTEDNKKKSDFNVNVTLSSYEAALIVKLREHQFGTFEVIKQHGEPRRVKIMGSEVLKESDAYRLQIESLQNQDTTNG